VTVIIIIKNFSSLKVDQRRTDGRFPDIMWYFLRRKEHVIIIIIIIIIIRIIIINL
jgi:hypothetical protein